MNDLYESLYVLDETGKPVREPDILRWGRWRHEHDRHVGLDEIGQCTVSTVFLAMDHSFDGGCPVLWETMVFGNEAWANWQDRYTSRGAAAAGHRAIVDRISRGEGPPD